MKISRPVTDSLNHLYISPLEMCNLNCKMCYTNKIRSILTNDQILGFVDKYAARVNLQSITFCGGEVFTLKDFPGLVNTLTSRGIYIQIITNGTVDRLEEIATPNAVNLIVSIDGLAAYHDRNRGKGMWRRTVAFVKKAGSLGFHREIFSIVTQENLPDIPKFEARLKKELGETLPVTYHPRKPLSYLQNHPVSNKIGEVKGFSFLTKPQWQELWRTKDVFPPKDLGCYQIPLMANGLVYACCEGIRPIGTVDSEIDVIVANFKKQIKKNCAEPSFMCGICQYRD